jgi:spectinomycin phosphotransferase
VNEPPVGIDDADVLAVVRAHWDRAADRVEHLPVGFGAWHWLASAGGEPRLFVTYDVPKPGHHSVETLASTYAGAAALHEAGLEFVVPSLPTSTGRFTVPIGDGLLSATPWVTGERPAVADGVRPLLQRLHATGPPAGIRRWRPLVGPLFSDELAERISGRWGQGPFGERAREAIQEALPAITRWTAAYHRLADAEDPRTWVTTHGEPHERNQLLTGTGIVLVDWESLMLAPADRDLRAPDGLFDLEWRLDEIDQYATWFAGPHGDTEDDREAIAGLEAELSRE